MLPGLDKRFFRKGTSFLPQIMAPDADVRKPVPLTTYATGD